MALRLKSNPAPMSGALYVSNPRKRKNVARKRNVAKKVRVVRKRKNVAKKKTVARKSVRKNSTKKGQVRKRAYTKRKNVAKKRKTSVAKKRKNSVAKKRKNSISITRKNSLARKRKNALARKRRNAMKKRKNSVAIKRRKNSTKKGQVRKTARKAYSKRKNSTKKGQVRKTARKAKRKNIAKKRTRIIRKNPMELAILKPVEKLVSKIPLIGKKVAPYTQPAVVAMVGGAGVMGAMASVGSLPVVGQYAKHVYGNAFGFTIMGIGLAVVSSLLPVKASTKKALALSFASAGGAINAGQLLMCGFDLSACAKQNKDMLGASEPDVLLEETSVEEEILSGLGDGMYYEIEPLSGISIENAHDMGGLDYSTATYGDAQLCPSDLSPMEGQMAIKGREAYISKFGTPPKRMAGQKRAQSAMAGKKGHRWGWMIKSLGYHRFSQLAQLPPQERKKLIRKMKASAIQASQATFDRELTGAYQGISYSGLAMDMSGLAIDNMGGIAIAGAGI